MTVETHQTSLMCICLCVCMTFCFPRLQICSHYNRGNGQHGICKFPNSCIRLHVCQHFLQGDCKFGEKCKREHSFNDQVLKILKGRGLSDDKEILGKLYRCKSIIKQPPPNLGK